MSDLCIYLFGKFNVMCCEHELAGFDSQKTRELLCYLLLNRDRPHSRESVASLLWDENQTNRPVRCLRKTIWQLRNALGSHCQSLGDIVLLVEPDWVQVNPKIDLWLDIAIFEQAYRSIREMGAKELAPPLVRNLERAVSLYRGGLQENWYHDWYLYERERLQHIYLILLDRLVEHYERCGEYENAIFYSQLSLRCENARERTHRRLMRLHHAAGDRTAALRQYDHCVAVLQEELGVPPAPRTTELYERIKLGQPVALVSSVTETHKKPDAVSQFPEVILRLKQFNAVLMDVHREINKILADWNRS